MTARALLAVALLAAAVPLPAAASPASADTLIDVGGHRLRFDVRRGNAPLTIVLESGGGADASSWLSVPDSVARRTGATVVTYDRAGSGGSDLGPAELTPPDEIRSLKGVLDRLATPRSRILVGTSYGGLLAVLYARLYPDEVVGLVLVDPMNPRFVEATGDFIYSTVPKVTEPANDRERLLLRLTQNIGDVLHWVAEIEPGLAVPMTVITAGRGWYGRGEEIDAAWRASHEAMAAAAPNRRLVVAEGSGHDVPEARPDLIVDAITGMAAEARAAE